MTLDAFFPPPPPPRRVIAHVDMDAFYASVEVRDNPALRGVPLIVGADPQKGKGRGVVTTASYAARKYGVRSAMPISQAWRLCPHGVYLRPRFDRYAEASARVFRILRRHASVVEAASIDEAYLDLTDVAPAFEDGAAVAERIREDVRKEEGLTCSVGLASSKLVAKIASDRDKPDGLTVVPPGTEAAFLAGLPATVIPGVGPKTMDVLREFGVNTCGDLARASATWLAERLGSWGPRLAALARGEDHEPVIEAWGRKSVGAESTFPEDEDDADALNRTLDELAREAADALADGKLAARTITLKLRLTDFTTFTRARTFPHPVADARDVADALKDLFAAHWPGTPVRLLGVRCSGLTQQPTKQVDLDAWPASELGEAAPSWTPPPEPPRWF